MTARAVALLAELSLGYSQDEIVDGVALRFLCCTHTAWGADPSRPPAPHKGISVFYAPDDSPVSIGFASQQAEARRVAFESNLAEGIDPPETEACPDTEEP